MDFLMSKVKNWKSKFNGSFINSLNKFIPKDINFDETFLDPYYEIVIWNHSIEQVADNNVNQVKDYFSNFRNRSGKSSLMHGDKESLMNSKMGESHILMKYNDPCYEIKDLSNGTELVTINVSAVTDYYTYMHFHSSISNAEKAIKDVESYMTEVFQRIDACYGAIDSNKYRYKIRLTELLILNDPKDSWLQISDERPFHYSNYLYDMRRIFRKSGKKYEAVLAFTKHKESGVLGKAFFRGAIGGSLSIGVVLLDDVLTTSFVAAHELGHLLGATHDDECDLGDYESIMKSIKDGDCQKIKFSSKSIEEMSRTMEYLKDKRRESQVK